MFRGWFQDPGRWPFVRGLVYNPLQPRLIEVNFLVDTGADTTSLMPGDAAALSIRYEELTDRRDAVGAGGRFTESRIECLLGFPDELGHHFYRSIVAVSPDVPDLWGAPSLLGRDILNRWRMEYDPEGDRLAFEIHRSDQFLPHPQL